jgi:hypothetical protein
MFPDPLIQHLTRTIVTEQRLSPPRPHTANGATNQADDRFQTFMHQNLAAVAKATASAVEAVSDQVPAWAALPAPPQPGGTPLAYLEPSPYVSAGALEGWVNDARSALTAAGWQIHIATRLTANHAEDDPTASHRRTVADWDALGRSSMAIVDIAGPEAPPGAAAVIGACCATRRPVYAPDPRSWWTFAHGREPNYRNLMIQYGLTGTFADPGEITTLAHRSLQLAKTSCGQVGSAGPAC